MVDSLIEMLGWALIDAAWQGVLVGALYALARLAFSDVGLRLAAGHLALLALAVLPIASLLLRLNAPAVLPGQGLTGMPTAIGASIAAQESLWSIDVWLPWLVAAWAVGVTVHTVRLFLQWRGLRRLCATSASVDPAWLEILAQLRARLGVNARVRLLHGAAVMTPMLVGVLRPTILLPTCLLLQLPRAQVELILIHELGHLRHLDTWFNLLQTCLDTLLFFHPAVHWISRRVRQDRELCCDELVVARGGDRLLYARTLLAMAETHHRGHAPALALGAAGGVLLERIERIVDVPASRQGTQMPAVGALLVLATLLWLFKPFANDDGLLRDLGLPPLAASSVAAALPALVGLQMSVSDLRGAMQPFVSRPMPADETVVAAPPTPPAATMQLIRDTIAPAIVQTFDPPAAFASPAPQAIAQPAPAAEPTKRMPIADTPVSELVVSAPAIRQVAPDYPASARLAAVEGYVLLRYRIGANGRATGVEVEASEPQGTFEKAARTALAQWRFDPDAAASAEYRQVFDFRLDAGERDAKGRDCAIRIGSRLCRPSR